MLQPNDDKDDNLVALVGEVTTSCGVVIVDDEENCRCCCCCIMVGLV